MSYQVLARKWRPKSFNELMGQEHVVTVLTNAITQQRLHHAYLFTGTRGVGKTTIARIFAKSLNCLQGITAQPCGICDACIDIDKGRFVDLLEIDAASRTKVDDTREILDNVQYAPTRGRYKVYLIDEVHMLSRSSFNALLKTLEEPPEHVKFILATTDPQKLPVTVLSRCLQFHLKALSVSQIEQQLRIILTAEQVTFEPLAVTLLAKAARGSMRDSLSLTDQAIAQGQGNISATNVQQMLGGVDHHWVYKILILLIKQDAKALMELSIEIASYAPNYGRLLAEFIQLLHQIAMTQIVGKHFDLSPEHNQLVDKFCQSMSPEDVQLYYQIVLTGRKDLPYAADEQAAFDMVLLRLLAFKPQLTVSNQTSEEQLNVNSISFDDVSLTDGALDKPVQQTVTESSNIAVNVESENTQQKQKEAPEELENQLAQELIAIEQTAQLQMEATPETDTSLSVMDKDYSQENHETLESNQVQPSVIVEHDVIEAAPNVALDPSLDNVSPQSSQSPQLASGIDAIIANRNMLRSRKKALEKNGKKSSDAEERQQTNINQKQKQIAEAVPDLSQVPDQPFTPDIIDPSVVKKANQVDKWANMIDAMALNGRLRQLALNATIDQASSENALVLSLNQASKHLKSDAALAQLQQFVSDYFAKPMQVEIRVVEQTIDDPYQIQGHINDKRYEYAKELLHADELVVALKTEFQAELDEKTIIAR